VDGGRKPNKKPGAAHKPCRAPVSDTLAGEETKKNEVMERFMKSSRYAVQVESLKSRTEILFIVNVMYVPVMSFLFHVLCRNIF
jgi:hypothetical protein